MTLGYALLVSRFLRNLGSVSRIVEAVKVLE